VIELLLRIGGDGAVAVSAAKLLAIGVSVSLNYAAYRHVVWPTSDRQSSGRGAAPSAARR